MTLVRAAPLLLALLTLPAVADWDAEVGTDLTVIWPSYKWDPALGYAKDALVPFRIESFDVETSRFVIIYGEPSALAATDILSGLPFHTAISGDGNTLAYCLGAVPLSSDDCQLAVEKNTSEGSVLMGFLVDDVATFSHPYRFYLGDLKVNKSGNLVAAVNPLDDRIDGFFGRLDIWKLNEDGLYELAVSRINSSPGNAYQPSLGEGLSVGTETVVVIENAAYTDGVDSRLLIYDIDEKQASQEPSAELVLPEDTMGVPLRSRSTNAVFVSSNDQTISVMTEIAEGDQYYVRAHFFERAAEDRWVGKGAPISVPILDTQIPIEDVAVGLSPDGNTAALLTYFYCADNEENSISDCPLGALDLYDFDASAGQWRRLEGGYLPALLPNTDGASAIRTEPPLLSDDGRSGYFVFDFATPPGGEYNGDFTSIGYEFRFEESSAQGLPIWLLYEATQ